ncbi:hypothetical protein E2P81_ATG08866 [Venturia nashicola]|uniref:Uncharacterized protein n=1 Tax=Venturia nashicola TaxID=86259 RepID=A0A4Z1NP51_9PEZI|nr:hypothetical protein E6O75_ATG09064 [Venturia nashicola]TLD23522.1 hypothetical protein E2P81_ATG08866 [Venturia nashicola]
MHSSAKIFRRVDDLDVPTPATVFDEPSKTSDAEQQGVFRKVFSSLIHSLQLLTSSGLAPLPRTSSLEQVLMNVFLPEKARGLCSAMLQFEFWKPNPFVVPGSSPPLFRSRFFIKIFLKASQTHSMYEPTYLQMIGPKEQDQTRVTFMDGGLTSTSATLFSENLSCLEGDAFQLGDHGKMLSSAEV